MVTLLFVGIIVAAVVLDIAVIQWLERSRRPAAPDAREPTVELVVPRSVFLHPSHVWARLEVDGQVTVGIDDLLRTLLGPTRSVELPSVGDQVVADERAASVTKDQSALHLPAPVSGIVTRVNPSFGADPASLRARPYRDGWLFRVRPNGHLAGELAGLRIGDSATEWMHDEVERLRGMYEDDILVGPVEGVLHRSGEATWRVFGKRFLARGGAPAGTMGV